MHVKVLTGIVLGNDLPLVLIGGPDSIESERHAIFMARSIKEICGAVGVPYIFKASYDKANRTSIKSFRGVGLKKGLAILAKVKNQVKVPVTTDIHSVEEAKIGAQVIDLIQIPALLSRQTDLIVAAASTGRAVNIKKGQFIAPHDIGHIITKAASTGNKKILITERGYMFGYNDVIADMRSLEIMKQAGHPVIFDASHTVQYPSARNNISSGDRLFIVPLARAAVAVGIAGLFLEVHDRPNEAKVDGPNSLKLSDLKNVLQTLKKIDKIVKRAHFKTPFVAKSLIFE